jgi:hypothetical protein
MKLRTSIATIKWDSLVKLLEMIIFDMLKSSLINRLTRREKSYHSIIPNRSTMKSHARAVVRCLPFRQIMVSVIEADAEIL